MEAPRMMKYFPRFEAARARRAPMSLPLLSAVSLAAALSVSASFEPSALADVVHVVGRGHTLEAISNRYHVPVKAIVEANHLSPSDVKRLKVGDELKIPGVTPKAAPTTKDKGAVPAAKKLETDKATSSKSLGTGHDKKAKSLPPGAGPNGSSGKPKKPETYAMRPKQPGVVHATRLATGEAFTVKLTDKKSKVSGPAQKSFERMMRSTGNLSHPIEPRLIALVGVVSNHFGGRKIEIISGFRPFTPTQHTAHSNHNIGHAIDFRVVGVPNEVVRDFCRTLKNVGVGYYPNSTFVHMDAREASTFWIDYSKPGEAPRYNSPNVAADEGTSDVAEAPPAVKDDANESLDTSDKPDVSVIEDEAPHAAAPSVPTPAGE